MNPASPEADDGQSALARPQQSDQQTHNSDKTFRKEENEMAAVDATPDKPVQLSAHLAEEGAPERLAGDPALLRLPSFIVGAVTLALVFIRVVPAGTTGAALPIVL